MVFVDVLFLVILIIFVVVEVVVEYIYWLNMNNVGLIIEIDLLDLIGNLLSFWVKDLLSVVYL